MKYVPVMLGSVLSVMLSYWLVFSFERINVKESRILTAIVDSALIIYLLHYPVVIIFSWLLDVWLPDNLSVLYVLIDFCPRHCAERGVLRYRQTFTLRLIHVWPQAER